MSNRDDQGDPTPRELLIGYYSTIMWAAILAAYLFWPDGRRLQNLLIGGANEFGDFLAGAFAPLAFLWLVITVRLQSHELRLQRNELEQSRKALMLQAEELRNSVEQMEKQTLLREEEARQAQKDRTNQEFEKGLDLLANELLDALGELAGEPRWQGQIFRFPTTETLRQWRQARGLHKTLSDKYELLRHALDVAPENFVEWCRGKQRFVTGAVIFLQRYEDWENAAHAERLFDIATLASMQGIPAMRNLLVEVIDAIHADSEESTEDSPSEQGPAEGP